MFTERVDNRPPIQLEQRDITILEELAGGLRNREINTKLNLCPGTAECHISKLYSIFGIDTKTDLRRLYLIEAAIASGYLPADTDYSSLIPRIPFASEKLRRDTLLARQQKQVFIHAVLGLSNKEIANTISNLKDPDKSSISEETVKNHMRSIFRKLDLFDRSELVPKAFLEGWLDEPRLREMYADKIALIEKLSPRELEILEKVAKGLFNKEIARTHGFFISEQTVKNHIGAIIRKIEARNRTEAALIYLLRIQNPKT